MARDNRKNGLLNFCENMKQQQNLPMYMIHFDYLNHCMLTYIVGCDVDEFVDMGYDCETVADFAAGNEM